MTLKELREAHKKNPDDNDIAAQLAEKNYFLGTASAQPPLPIGGASPLRQRGPSALAKG